MTDAPPPPPPQDQPPAPGYWKASDGNWYPPQPPAGTTTMMPPPAAAPKSSGCLKWGLIIGGIGLFLFIGLIGLIVLGANRAANELKEATEAESAPPWIPGGPDAQEEDQRVSLGQSVRLSGYTATVTAARFEPTLSEFEEEGYLVADVTIENRDDRAQQYNTLHWKLQTPNGQVIDPTFAGDPLGSGLLVPGGNVSGRITFEVGQTKGEFFIIYKPDLLDAARGIWPVDI